MPTIERFTGYPVPLGGSTGAWPLPGGGYRGSTVELDALVAEAAGRLAEEYDRDVVIRFNSDRRSGGAWLRDKATADCLIGVCAGYQKDRGVLSMDELIALPRAEHGALPDVLYVTTNVKVQALRDPALATQGHFPGGIPYSWVAHGDIEAAMIWLGQNAVVPDADAD